MNVNQDQAASTTPNVGDMPQDFWAWTDSGKLVPLGICDRYSEAFERADKKCPAHHWVFSRDGLREFVQELKREVPQELVEA